MRRKTMNLLKKTAVTILTLAGFLLAGASQAGSLDPFGDPLTDTEYLSYEADFEQPFITSGDPTMSVDVLSGGSVVGGATESIPPSGNDLSGLPLGDGPIGFGAAIGRNSVVPPFTDGVTVSSTVSSNGDNNDQVSTNAFLLIDNHSTEDLNVPVVLDFAMTGSGSGVQIQIGLEVLETAENLFTLIASTDALITPTPDDVLLTGAGLSGSQLFLIPVVSFFTDPFDSFRTLQLIVTASGIGDDFVGTLDFARLRIGAVPEPATLALIGLGLLGMAGVRKRIAA
jgi:hypothetical protein